MAAAELLPLEERKERERRKKKKSKSKKPASFSLSLFPVPRTHNLRKRTPLYILIHHSFFFTVVSVTRIKNRHLKKDRVFLRLFFLFHGVIFILGLILLASAAASRHRSVESLSPSSKKDQPLPLFMASPRSTVPLYSSLDFRT